MDRRRASGVLALCAALIVSACGEAAEEQHWIDALVEETSEQARAEQAEAQPADANAAPAPDPSSPWNELPLGDGVFADRTGADMYRRDVIEIPDELPPHQRRAAHPAARLAGQAPTDGEDEDG